jgi:hypothetical protein
MPWRLLSRSCSQLGGLAVNYELDSRIFKTRGKRIRARGGVGGPGALLEIRCISLNHSRSNMIILIHRDARITLVSAVDDHNNKVAWK